MTATPPALAGNDSSSVLLTPEQTDIRALAREMLTDRYPTSRIRQLVNEQNVADDEWTDLVEFGWTGLNVAEEFGGTGLGLLERQLVIVETGRSLGLASYLDACVLPTDVLELLASEAARAELLPLLCAGERRITVVDGRTSQQRWSAAGVTATSAGDGWVLSGEADLVSGAGVAANFLVIADVGVDAHGLFMIERDSAGLRIAPVRTLDLTRRDADVTFTAAAATTIGGTDTGLLHRRALQEYDARRDLALIGDMLGASGAALDLTLNYVRVREQFGRPVGSFQAVKHRLAVAWTRVDAALELMYAALDTVVDEAYGPALSAAAAVAGSEASRLAVAEAIQFHGGMGFTWEVDAHLYYRRWFVDAARLGDRPQHLQRLATVLGL
jgi:alkylation response protein AidB-like acyl-CoA dehydrogenase